MTSQMTLLGLMGIETVDEFVSTESTSARSANKYGCFIQHTRVGLKKQTNKQVNDNFKVMKTDN